MLRVSAAFLEQPLGQLHLWRSRTVTLQPCIYMMTFSSSDQQALRQADGKGVAEVHTDAIMCWKQHLFGV